MELRPRKGRSAQPPSTPTLAKPSSRQPPQSTSRRKPASVPSSPILIPSDAEATDPKQSNDELVNSSPALKQESHDTVPSVETPLSAFVKSARKALSSKTKQKKKAASSMKKKVREVSPIAEQDIIAMEEVCTTNNTIVVCLDDTATRGQIASVEDIDTGETLTDNVYRDSIELGGEKSSRKGKKLQSAKKRSAAKSGRRKLVEEVQNEEVALEALDVKLDRVDDQEPSLVVDAPLMDIPDGCPCTLSLILSDDENARSPGELKVDVCERKSLASSPGELKVDVCERKSLASSLEEDLQGQAQKASSKKKTRFKNESFGEESLNRKLFEETAAEPDDYRKDETDMEAKLRKEGETRMDIEKIEKSEQMVAGTSSKAQYSEPCIERLKETDQPEIEVLENKEENFEKSDRAVVEEDAGNECTQVNVSEESSQRESFTGHEREEEFGNGYNGSSFNMPEGDPMHIEDHNQTNVDNDSEASSSDDEDEVDFASIFASSMKTHLHISEPSVSREPTQIQPEQDVQKGVKSPLTKVATKGSFLNGNISRLGLSWAPKVALLASKNGRPQRAGVVEARPSNIWEKDRCLQDGLCVPPVDPVKLNKLANKQKKDTAGDKWYNLSAPTITPELKKELQLVKLRGVLDPKRHYKAEDSKGLPKYFQVGTVVGGPADFYSGRLTNKEQKNSLANELLSDSSLSSYRKRKYLEIQDHKQAGGKGFMKKKKSKRTPAWAKI